MKSSHLFGPVFLFVSLIALGVPESRADVYHGRVVDAETGAPVADAVLVVVWWTRAYIGFVELPPRDFHQAMEALTEADGKFSLDAAPRINWNPLTYVDSPPTIVIYKPGYRPLMNATANTMGFRTMSDVVEALKKGAVIRLAKPNTQEETIRYTGVGSLIGVEVPMEKVPNLTRLVNIHRKLVGLTTFFPEIKEGDGRP
jgi:hypothetical protein